MTTDFDSFDESPLGAFMESPLNARNRDERWDVLAWANFESSSGQASWDQSARAEWAAVGARAAGREDLNSSSRPEDFKVIELFFGFGVKQQSGLPFTSNQFANYQGLIWAITGLEILQPSGYFVGGEGSLSALGYGATREAIQAIPPWLPTEILLRVSGEPFFGSLPRAPAYWEKHIKHEVVDAGLSSLARTTWGSGAFLQYKLLSNNGRARYVWLNEGVVFYNYSDIGMDVRQIFLKSLLSPTW